MSIRFRGLLPHLLVLLASVMFLASAWAQPPSSNLMVSWRLASQAERSQVTAAVSQGVTVRTQSHQHDSVQSVVVLNGGQARLFMGRSVPVSTWQFAWQGPAGQSSTAEDQPRSWAVSQTQWVDLGEGLTVRPRWSGGRTVTVELEASSRQPIRTGELSMASGGGYEPDGQSRRVEVSSTVGVPLGEWTVVARRDTQMQRQQAGTWSTRHIDSSQHDLLEIRISLP